MFKIFLAGPIEGQDSELVHYRFEAARQRIQTAHPDATVFSAAEDLDNSPLREASLASGFDPDVPSDRKILLVGELLESRAVYLLPGWENDEFCIRVRSTAEELGAEIYLFPEMQKIINQLKEQ